jgi:predicted RNA binding protein YcfA (HicA-like mRNA interferase family)
LTSKEIIKRLEKDGFVRKGLRGGSHQKWTHSDGRIVIVPHPKKDFKLVPLNLSLNKLGGSNPTLPPLILKE